MWCSTGFNHRAFTFPYLCQRHASRCELKFFLYADNLYLMFQHKELEEIEWVLNSDFENICDWFVDNKLSIHFGEDKTKSILFASHCKIKTIKKFNMKYQDIEIKQHSQMTYLGSVMDETMSGEPMT